MEKLKISSELFVLNHGNDYILYLPLKSILAIVNTDTIKLLNAINEGKNFDANSEIVKELTQLGVFEEMFYPSLDSIYKPTHVTFLPSFVCNLKCLYCYSYGGDNSSAKIDFRVAKKAIDFITKNAVEINKKEISVNFHGGGEPMMYVNKSFIEEIIEYAKFICTKERLTVRSMAVTNGIDIGKFNISWLKNNFSRFVISLDGPPDIQNFQRPRRGRNKDSYTPALKTINLFEKNKIEYSLRATITKYNVHRMPEIVKHFKNISSKKRFHFEPLFECGRCKTSNLEAPTYEEFIKNYCKAFETAKNYGIEINYSGARMIVSDHFCGAAGNNFFITPDSYVTTCLEACRIDEIENEPFLIGKYNERKNEFEFYQNKIDLLKSRKVMNMESCSDCFCKYSCSGDCLAKVLKLKGNMFDATGNYRCEINKSLTNLLLKEIL